MAALALAVIDGSAGEVERLLKAGDVDVGAFEDNSTILHVAASRGQVDVLKVLHSHRGVDFAQLITLRNDSGENALHSAARFGHEDVVTWFCEERLVTECVNVKDLKGRTPVAVAKENGFIDIVHDLVEYILEEKWDRVKFDEETQVEVSANAYSNLSWKGNLKTKNRKDGDSSEGESETSSTKWMLIKSSLSEKASSASSSFKTLVVTVQNIDKKKSRPVQSAGSESKAKSISQLDPTGTVVR